MQIVLYNLSFITNEDATIAVVIANFSPEIFFGLRFAIAQIAITTAMVASSFHLDSRSSKSLSFNVISFI